ncbi:hypothetical protein MnTg04_01775 [bacterium MnTg04]|nr:hypothetical protein MnTg04_01775 [bacterium MnTg04]
MLGAGDRKVASRIAQSFLLLQRLIVLFIDDDQPEIGHWRKHGRPCAHNEFRQRLARIAPGGQAVDIAKSRVQHYRLDAEPLSQPGNQLRRQANLGHKNQYLPVVGQHITYHLQIHLGFATASNTIEQKGCESLLLSKHRNGGALIVV